MFKEVGIPDGVFNVIQGEGETGEILTKNEDLAKIYGGNKMRVYQQVWEGAPEGQWDKEYQERVRLRKEFMEKYGTR